MNTTRFTHQQFFSKAFVLFLFILASFLTFSPFLAAADAADVTLAWDANSEDNLAGYKLYYRTDTGGAPYDGSGLAVGDSPVIINLEDLDDADTPVFGLTGLEEGEQYFFALTAFDSDGLESDYSDEVSYKTDLVVVEEEPAADDETSTPDETQTDDTTSPDEGTTNQTTTDDATDSVQDTTGSNTVTLAWDANSEDNLAGYHLYYKTDTSGAPYDGTGLAEGDSPVTIYVEDLDEAGAPVFTLTGLEEGKQYFFALTAFDTDNLESDYSDEVSYEVETAVAAYSITASSTEGGSISPAGVTSVAHGGDLSYTITPDEGYHVADIIVDETSVGAATTYAFANIATSHAIEAVFEENIVEDPIVNDDTTTSDETQADNTDTDESSAEETSDSDPNTTEIIIDNGSDGTNFTGTWKNSVNPSYYGTVSVYSAEVGADYTFETAATGIYEVSLWWTAAYNRSSEVPVEIWDGDTLLDVVSVNEQENGGQWNLQGTYSFSDTARIVVISDTSSITVADAVKLTFVSDQVSPSKVIIDNGTDSTYFSGAWKESIASSYYGTVSVYSAEVGADYTFETAVTGTYEVSLWWTAAHNRGSQVPVEIWDGDSLLDIVFVNEQENGGQWNVQGTYSFTGIARIVVVSDTSSIAVADAVRLALVQ